MSPKCARRMQLIRSRLFLLLRHLARSGVGIDGSAFITATFRIWTFDQVVPVVVLVRG